MFALVTVSNFKAGTEELEYAKGAVTIATEPAARWSSWRVLYV